MTRRTLAVALSAAAVLAVTVVLLVSAIGSDSAGHTMPDGGRMDDGATTMHTMPGDEPMDGTDTER